MKSKRHELIRAIIARQPVETQEELADALRAEQVQVTQATVSRDIKEMGLIKVPSVGGHYRYAEPQKRTALYTQGRLARLFRDNVLGMDFSENLLVLKTLPGSANIVAAGLDSSDWQEIIGTIAGDDNVLVIIKPKKAVPAVMARLGKFFGAVPKTLEEQ